jgi:hypothetical protein
MTPKQYKAALRDIHSQYIDILITKKERATLLRNAEKLYQDRANRANEYYQGGHNEKF